MGTKDGTLVGNEFGKIVGKARLGKVGNWVGARVEILVAMGGFGDWRHQLSGYSSRISGG